MMKPFCTFLRVATLLGDFGHATVSSLGHFVMLLHLTDIQFCFILIPSNTFTGKWAQSWTLDQDPPPLTFVLYTLTSYNMIWNHMLNVIYQLVMYWYERHLPQSFFSLLSYQVCAVPKSFLALVLILSYVTLRLSSKHFSISLFLA